MAKRKITRTKGNRFCTLEVELSDRNGKGLELSITGMAGRVQSRAQSKRDALQTWISYFDDQPEEIMNMNRRFNKRFTSSAGAARFVIATDGEFHGVDVVQEEGNKTFVVECCGQIRDEIAEFFPEAEPFFQYHLNGLNAGCSHQRALGWGHGRDVALAAADCTLAQLHVLNEEIANKTFKDRQSLIVDMLLHTSSIDLLRKAGISPTIHAVELLDRVKTGADLAKTCPAMNTWLEDEAKRQIPDKYFTSAIFKDSINAPCPECGYKYGTEWLFEPLPQSVIDWVNSL